MKIIDSKKDYYDYLVSIYGIDEGVTFDRRTSTVLETGIQGDVLFTKLPHYNDKERVLKRVYNNEKHKYEKALQGLILYFALEVGTTHYIFKVERYLENGGLVLSTILTDKLTDCKKLNDKSIINIIPINYDYGTFTINNKIRYNLNQIIENPILRDTQIPSLITPEEIYDEIYNYIISTKEKPIKDKRNDIEKLLSRGFDKKTSFRKM